jgi:hypothetical protein
VGRDDLRLTVLSIRKRAISSRGETVGLPKDAQSSASQRLNYGRPLDDGRRFSARQRLRAPVLLAHNPPSHQTGLSLVAKEVPNAHLDSLQGRYHADGVAGAGDALGGDRRRFSMLTFRENAGRCFRTPPPRRDALSEEEGLRSTPGLFSPTFAFKRFRIWSRRCGRPKTPTFLDVRVRRLGPAWGALREMGYGEGKYGSARLMAAERVRDEKKQATLRDLRARFIDSRVLNHAAEDAVPRWIEQETAVQANGTIYRPSSVMTGDKSW